MENIDKTIDSICIWIQKRLGAEMALVENQADVAEMVKALAELIDSKKNSIPYEVKTNIPQNGVDMQRLKEHLKKSVRKNLT